MVTLSGQFTNQIKFLFLLSIDLPKENNEPNENKNAMWVSDEMLSQLKEIEKFEKKRYDEQFLVHRNPLLDLLKAGSYKNEIPNSKE